MTKLNKLSIRTIIFTSTLTLTIKAITVEQFVHSAAYGKQEIIEQYIKEGGDVNARNQLDNTALVAATISDRKNIVIYLLAKGADVNYPKQSGTALYQAASPTKIAIAKILLSVHNINPDIATMTGVTPLHKAIECHNNELVKLLIEKGANRYIKDIKGKTPMDYANQCNNSQAKELLTSFIPSLVNLTANFINKNKSYYNPEIFSQSSYMLPQDVAYFVSDLCKASDLSPVFDVGS